ncbi:MAG TPA: extracellular solute-binding protein [Clostridia bacterium]
MKKLAVILAIMLALSSFMLMGCTGRSNVLKVYNWQDYIDEDVLAGFEDYYFQTYGEKITLEYYTFETNESMYTKIARSKMDYDLVIPSEYMAERMYEKGLVQSIDYSNIPNFYASLEYSENGKTRLDPTLQELYSDKLDYFLPYMWGTLGILYNKDLLKEEDIDILEGDEAFEFWQQANGVELDIDSTEGLWVLDENGQNIVFNWSAMWSQNYGNYKIYMKNSIRDSFAAAAIYANADELKKYIGQENHGKMVDMYMNDASDQNLKKIEKVLKDQRPYIKGYEVDNGKDEMVQGNIALLLAWSGDAVWCMTENESLGYYVPREGANIWADGFVIPKYAKNKLAAERFINYLFMQNIDDPWGEESDYGDHGFILMDTIGYTSSLIDVQERYYQTFLEDYLYDEDGLMANALNILDALFPSESQKARCAVMKDFGDRQEDVLKMWSRVLVS